MSQGIYLFDKEQHLIGSVSDVSENTQEQELCGQITGQAKIPYKVYKDSAYFGVKEENNFWLYKIRKVIKEGGYVTISGIHIFDDELKGKVIRDIRNQNTTGNLVVEKLLRDTGWVLGANSVSKVSSQNFYYQSALSAFYDAVKTWDFEFIPVMKFKDGKIIEKRLDIFDEISRDHGKWFEYGDKLLSVVAESSTDDLYTAFIGRGKGLEKEDEDGNKTGGYSRKLKFDEIEYSSEKDGIEVSKPKGQDYIEIKKATNLYGYPDGSPRIGVIDFDNIEDPKELADATFAYALKNCRPKVQLKAKAITSEKVELGETVAIIRSDMNIRYKTRVFKIKKDFIKDKVVEFEFGDKVLKSAGERLKDEKQEERKKAQLINTYIDNLRDEITASYFNDSAYNYDLKIGNKYGLPAGYYSFDRPIDKDPTKVIYMGAGKLLIANSKKPNGQWDWRTAATADGLVADEVVGTLGIYAKVNANQINVNNDFARSDLGKKIADDLKIIDNKVVDQTGKIRDDLRVVDGKIVDLEGRVVLQDVLYNNVKITPQKGLQVLDNYNRERVQLGNWAYGRYGLKVSDESGNITVLDDNGIMQSWQDGRCDNTDHGHPLRIPIYLPKETARLYKANLRIHIDAFRAYSKSTKTEDARSSTTSSGGGEYVSDTTGSGGGTYATTHGAANVNMRENRYYVKGGSGGYVDVNQTYYHEHEIEIGEHSHNVSFDIPSHEHDFTIPAHSHDINYGIYEESNYDSNMEIFINGFDKTSTLTGSGYFSGDKDDLDITSYLNKGQWNLIEIKTRNRMRIDATVFIQALLNYGGY